MAEMQYYIDGVTKAEERVEKCKGTIERHEKQLVKKLAIVADLGVTLENQEDMRASMAGTGNDRYWDLCEVKHKIDDIKGAQKKLKEAEKALQKWKEKLTIQINQDKFLEDNVPEVIKYFLDEWVELAFDWHIARLQHFKARKLEIQADPTLDSKGRQKELEISKMFAGALVVRLSQFYKEDEMIRYLLKELEQDKRFKMLDLVYRMKDAVGEITDAGGLRIANGTGNLNGIIIGEKGKAKVETISAGGYAVQCFHYRTLVHKI